MGLVPPAGKLVPEPERQCKFRTHPNHIFGVPRAQPRTPAERGRRRIVQQAAYRALQESLQTGESCLTVLAERQILIGAEPLKPRSEVELMATLRERYPILICEQIPGDREIASVVASRKTQLGGWIRRRAASHHDRTKGTPCQETGQTGCGSTRCGFASEEVTGPRKARPGGVEQVGGKNMSFFDARHLLAEALHVRAVQIGAGGREVGAVVDCVNRAQRIRGREYAIQARRSEVVPNGLQRIVERL